MTEPVRSKFSVGEPVPWFRCAASNNDNFYFGAAGGRYVVLSFLGAPDSVAAQSVLRFVTANKEKFDDTHLSFFGVLNQKLPNFVAPIDRLGIRYFWDLDGAVAALYGPPQPCTYVLDSMLRVVAALPFTDSDTHRQQLVAVLSGLKPLGTGGEAAHAPVLILPRIFEPAVCRKLIALYHEHGGEESGYMREVDGRTVPVLNAGFKRRKDFRFDDQEEFAALRESLRLRLLRRLVPEITKSFQYKPTRLERYIVAHYSGEDQGFFNPHRDNTTGGTAHRRFACTINLNADEYEGGDLRFPEFGPRTYRAPTGGAVVFSCSLLHEATPVTQGERYAFLPFFYDDESAKIRDANRATLDTDYRRED